MYSYHLKCIVSKLLLFYYSRLYLYIKIYIALFKCLLHNLYLI